MSVSLKNTPRFIRTIQPSLRWLNDSHSHSF